MTGQTISHYRLLDKLGEGGMGVLYKAEDLKLRRIVALKFLQPDAAENRLRFLREAQAAASLNHPNICTIHEIDEEHAFIAMEFIEGYSVKQKIEDRPLPLVEALDIAMQAGAGLQAAHQKGIVHRDIKPANLMIATQGHVKLTDFGLAQIGDRTRMTKTGVSMGTPAYMSPEQAQGDTVDRRTDIWSLGVVLYEMVTGRVPFRGETDAAVARAILDDEPEPPTALRSGLPVSLDRIVSKALAKSAAQRYQHIDDLLVDLRAMQPGASGPSLPDNRRVGVRTGVWWIAVAMGAIVLLALPYLLKRSHISPTMQLQRITDVVGMEESPAISPDGKTIAFVAPSGRWKQIWIKLLAGGTPLQLTRDDGDHEQPRWTPDSSSLIYYAPSSTLGKQGAIMEIPALGGIPRRIAAAVGGADVSHDGRRVALFQINAGRLVLSLMSRDGSGAAVIKQMSAGTFCEFPRWSPDDRWIAFQSGSAMVYERLLYVLPSGGGDAREVARGNLLRGFSWLADGAGLVYSSSFGSTIAYPPVFNLRAVNRSGKEDRQITFGDLSYVSPDLQASGKLVASGIRSQSNIWKFPVNGSPEQNTRAAVQITRQTGHAQTPSISPDGRELVYLSDSGGHGNLWVVQSDGSRVRQLTFERDPGAFIGVPVWSPVGNQIVFIQTKAGKTEQWVIQSDGDGLRRLVTNAVWTYWSGDGRWVYYGASREGKFCIDKMPSTGGKSVTVRCDNSLAPSLAPDGSTLYFISPIEQEGSIWDWQVRSASPESGPSKLLAQIAGSRIPVEALNIQTFPAPDGKSLVVPLTDRGTSNLWIIPTEGGPMRRITDFGDRAIVIARRVSWSPDARSIFAAVAETDADIVMLEGLLK